MLKRPARFIGGSAMKCLRCQQEAPSDAAFCPACGAKVEAVCASCGTANAPTHKFCKSCGIALGATTGSDDGDASSRSLASYTPKHLAAEILKSRAVLEGERKQVTVLFADVVGFSGLSGRLDPEAVHTIMDGCFELLANAIHRYEGTINQFTGDGVMALFGAPITHEDHAVRALEAGCRVQEELVRYANTVQSRWGVPFQMRIGINTGLVVVGKIGDNLRMDYTAQGDTTNIAARLQQMAPPGAIWVGEATYSLAADAFEWQPARLLSIKGRDAPLPVHELVGRAKAKSRFDAKTRRGLTHLVGRQAEFEELLDAWREARAGHGRVVSIVGEAGLGKSRLIHEFKQYLAQDDMLYLEGSCFVYGDTISYLPFVQIVSEYFGLDGARAETEAKQDVRTRLMDLGSNRQLVEPYLHNLLAYEVEDQDFATLPPDLIRERTVNALVTLVLDIARRQPLVLIVEDLHWIDKATEEVIGSLAEALSHAHLMLVLGYRPEYLHAWATKPHHVRIPLNRLADASSAEMVRAILTKPYASSVSLARLSVEESAVLVQELVGAAPVPKQLTDVVVSTAEGNPFFLEELTRAVLEIRDLRSFVADNTGRPSASLQLPTTVQGVVLARIDRLSDDLKQILQIASVVGRVFGVNVLAQVTGDQSALERSLVQLEQLDFVYLASPAPERQYSFKHALSQQAVYDALLRARREVLHEQVARAIETLHVGRFEEVAELLAYHYTRSPNADKAATYLDLANQKATGMNAMAEAKVYFVDAMRLLDALPPTESTGRRRIALLANQLVMSLLLYELPPYYEDLTRFESQAREIQDQGLLGAYYGAMAFCEGGFGDFRRAIPRAKRAIELSDQSGNVEYLTEVYAALQWSYVHAGDYESALTLGADIKRAVDRGSSVRFYAYGLGAMTAAAACLGQLGRATESFETEFRVGEQLADRSAMCHALWTMAWALLYKQDMPRALDVAKRAVELAPTTADRSWAEGTLGMVYCRGGDPERAIQMLEPLVPGYRGGRFRMAEVFTAFLGEAYWRAGQTSLATQTLRELLEVIEPCGMRSWMGLAYRLLGEISGTDDATAASSHFERSVGLLAETDAQPELALACASYGRFLRRQKDIGNARRYLERAFEISERLGMLTEPERLRHELAQLQMS
jgi:class 3 adenylate cyclase/tetratricopeptide (TPR) repeat protein